MLDPAVGVLITRVVMRPMHDSTFFAPFILAIQFHDVTHLKLIDSRRQIDIVRHQNRAARRNTDDEFLMTASLIIVR